MVSAILFLFLAIGTSIECSDDKKSLQIVAAAVHNLGFHGVVPRVSAGQKNAPCDNKRGISWRSAVRRFITSCCPCGTMGYGSDDELDGACSAAESLPDQPAVDAVCDHKKIIDDQTLTKTVPSYFARSRFSQWLTRDPVFFNTFEDACTVHVARLEKTATFGAAAPNLAVAVQRVLAVDGRVPSGAIPQEAIDDVENTRMLRFFCRKGISSYSKNPRVFVWGFADHSYSQYMRAQGKCAVVEAMFKDQCMSASTTSNEPSEFKGTLEQMLVGVMKNDVRQQPDALSSLVRQLSGGLSQTQEATGVYYYTPERDRLVQ